MNVSTPVSACERFARIQPGIPSLFLVTAVALISPTLTLAQPEEAFNERPAEASVVIENSSRYQGVFTLSTLARVCGEVPAELNFAGVPAFVVHFYPETGQGEIRDITFDSKELVGGVTTSSTFFLSAGVHSPSIGSPPAYVLDTSRPGVSGVAELTSPEPGTHELTIEGINEMGESIRLSLKCSSRA
jgi:hypothetical protein